MLHCSRASRRAPPALWAKPALSHNNLRSEDPMSAMPGTAVLLLNLGTPDAPTPAAVRRYLAEFLKDRRVIDYPRWLWLPILHGVILRVRPRKSAHAYAKIWTPQGS